jgi:hypothetical protein
MISLTSAISTDLTWSRISHRTYELKLNGEVLGTLQRRSLWSSSVFAETKSGHWIFRRGLWFGASTYILDASSSRKLATFRYVWGSGGGTLAFADGDTYWLECEGWWRPVWRLVAEHGHTLLRLHPREKSVELPSAVTAPGSRLALLIMFTWYRVLQAEEEAMIEAIAAS